MIQPNIRFSALDSLRGLAAIAVAIYHFKITWAGYLAVDFFLVLSGFILSHSYLYKENKISVVDFISHRLARLYPLHFFTLFTFIAAYLFVSGKMPRYPDGTLFTFLQNLTFTQNIGLNPKGLTYNAPSWSIAVEFWVNIIFILFISKETKSSTLFFIALLGLLIIYGNTGHLDTYSQNYYQWLNSGILRGISSFFLGILSYRLYLYYKDNLSIAQRINKFEIMSIILMIIIIFVRPDRLDGVDIFAPFLFMLMVFVFTYETGILSKLLLKIRYLGEISYSIYLNQITILMLIQFYAKKYDSPVWFTLFIYLIILIIYSHFTYQYIEKPLRKKGRNFLSKIVTNQ